jgi:hypothetical protein
MFESRGKAPAHKKMKTKVSLRGRRVRREERKEIFTEYFFYAVWPILAFSVLLCCKVLKFRQAFGSGFSAYFCFYLFFY